MHCSYRLVLCAHIVSRVEESSRFLLMYITVCHANEGIFVGQVCTSYRKGSVVFPLAPCWWALRTTPSRFGDRRRGREPLCRLRVRVGSRPSSSAMPLTATTVQAILTGETTGAEGQLGQFSDNVLRDCKVVSCEPQRLVVTLPVTARITNSSANLHGGASCTLVDTLSAL